MSADLKVYYKGVEIASIDTSASATKTLLTSGKYCEADIVIEYTTGPAYTNLIPLSEEVSSSAIFNSGLGYKNGYYISAGAEKANASDCLIGCIPYVISGSQPTDILYIKGYTAGASASHTRMCVRSANKSSVAEYNGFLSSNGVFDIEVLDAGTGYYKLTPKTGIHTSFSDIGWLQFSFHQADASGMIITKNEPIE